MEISRRITLGAVTTVCIAAAAAPGAMAKSRTTHYSGKTRDGDPISFTLAGSRVMGMKAYVPTVCDTPDPSGLPLRGSDPFDPPGSFPLAHTTTVKAKRANAILNTSDVTKNFVVSFRRSRHGVVIGRLHADYSFLMILYTYPISSRAYVCTGDTTFAFRLPASLRSRVRP